jgi:hypothetical protein
VGELPIIDAHRHPLVTCHSSLIQPLPQLPGDHVVTRDADGADVIEATLTAPFHHGHDMIGVPKTPGFNPADRYAETAAAQPEPVAASR